MSPNRPIWIAGEALIDLIPTERMGENRIPIVGGGPANSARALSRLGMNAYFIDGISTSEFGQMAKQVLESDGVHLDHVNFSDAPAGTAKVSLDANGGASYIFTLEGTATFNFDRSWLPAPSESEPAALLLGTLGLLVEPGASELFAWTQQVAKFAPIILDPNIRSSVLSDRAAYQAIVDKWAAISQVVKVSDDDIAWLYPDLSHQEVANLWFGMGVKLVVVTLGADGVKAFTPQEEVSVPGVRVTVVDTVGAGDTVGAIITEGVVLHGLDNLRGELLKSVLTRAAAAAAITCSRAGAQPPFANELTVG